MRVMRGGEVVRFSKRSGEFVTLRELFDGTGPNIDKVAVLR